MKELAKKLQNQITRRQQSDTFLPAADIRETSDEIVLKLDMPGVGKDDLDIKVENDALKIHGKVNAESAGDVLYAEQRIGDYYREFALSEDLDQAKINAAMNAGVLTLNIAKAEKVKPRRIAITVG